HGDASARDDVLHQLHHSFLDDGGLARGDQAELRLVDVDADDPMPVAREACKRNGTHVAQAEDADIHAEAPCSYAVCSAPRRAKLATQRSMMPSSRRIDLSHA